MHLDLKTLFVVVMLGYFTGALVLAVLAATVRSVPRSMRTGWGLWAFCMLLSGLCAFLISQRGAISDALSIVLANALLTIGFGLRPNAIALLQGKKMPYLLLPVAGTLGWLGLYSFEFFRNDMLLRVIYINGFCLIGTLLCVWESLHLDRRQISNWFLATAFVIDASVRLSIVAANVQTHYPSLLDAYQTLPLQVCFLALIAAITIKIVGISISIFERQRQQFQNEAEHDPLTGLLNQRGFIRRARGELEPGSSANGPYAVAVMEIDDLAEIAEQYGTSMRDACLKLLARITGLTLPASALAGLDGNGQIAFFLPSANLAEGVSCVRRISQSLTSEYQTATSSQLSVSLSSGVFAGSSEVPVQRALEIAAHCCRKAQAQGRNKIMTHNGADDGRLRADEAEPPFALRSRA